MGPYERIWIGSTFVEFVGIRIFEFSEHTTCGKLGNEHVQYSKFCVQVVLWELK